MAYWPASAMILLQIADGSLTLMGIQKFGGEAEGNPLLRYLMENIGSLPTLLFVKLFAIILIVIVARYVYQIAWLNRALIMVSAFYVIFAVTPWLLLLSLA